MLRGDGCCIALLDVEDDRPVSDGSSPRYGIVCREGCMWCVRAVAAGAVVNLSVSTVC
jgi:hypothetical protein